MAALLILNKIMRMHSKCLAKQFEEMPLHFFKNEEQVGYIINIRSLKGGTSFTLKAAPPLESPSSFVKMAPVIPISRLKVVTNATGISKDYCEKNL